MKHSDYAEPENWFGSFYELAIEYHPVGDDSRLLEAISSAWAAPYLIGPWYRQEDHGEPAPVPTSLESEGLNRLYGLLRVTEDTSVGCMILTVRETLRGDSGSDWLDLCIPMGMLNLVLAVHYPLLHLDNPWLTRVDDVLLNIAESVYRASPFDLAIIDEEASDLAYASDLSHEHLLAGGILLPAASADKFTTQIEGLALPSGLRWFPRRSTRQG